MNGNGEIETKAGSGKFSLRRLAPLIVIGLGAAAFFAFGLQDYLTFDMLRDNRRAILDFVAAKPFSAALIFITVYAVSVIFVPPSGTVMTLLGGFIFGAVFATSYVVIGATIGATVIFLAARYSFGDYLHKRAGSAVRKMEAGFRDNEISYMLVLRLIPFFPFWLVNIAPAFLNVRLRNYVIGTFIGIIPGTVIYTMIGSGLGGVLDDADDLSVAIMMKPEIIFGLAGLGLLALVPVAFKKLKAWRK